MASVSNVLIEDDDDDFEIEYRKYVKTTIVITNLGAKTGVPFASLPESHQRALRAYIEGEK